MKKNECAKVRSSLRNYLRGHVFKPEAMKIERHLKSCPVCSSEFQALKRVAETREMLKAVTPPEGILQGMKDGLTGMSKLKKLVYRPLWVLAIVATLTLVYLNLFPERRDVEIESIEKSLPPASTVASAPTVTPDPVADAAAPIQAAAAQPTQTAAKPDGIATPVEPLTIMIVTDDLKEAIRRINDQMSGPGAAATMKLTETSRQMPGKLTVQELITLVKNIEAVGKVRYDRKRLNSLSAAQKVPFILKLKTAPKVADQSPSQAGTVSESAPAAEAAPSAEAAAPAGR